MKGKKKLKDKWIIASYLIDAKKNVDSVWFIENNLDQLKYLDLRKKTREIRNEYYINLCLVIDEYTKKSGKKKSVICNQDQIINRIFYERDKNAAHKDESYVEHGYSSLEEMVEDMKSEVVHVREKCASCIPEVVTLDFVPHDKELFRLIHKLSADEEERIRQIKYLPKTTSVPRNNVIKRTIIHDIEEIARLPFDERAKYCVVFNDGICPNEGIQERQDSSILFNLLFGLNIWPTMNMEVLETVKELNKLGVIDDYGIIQRLPSDPEKQARALEIIEKYCSE